MLQEVKYSVVYVVLRARIFNYFIAKHIVNIQKSIYWEIKKKIFETASINSGNILFVLLRLLHCIQNEDI